MFLFSSGIAIDLSAGPKPSGKMVPADLMLDYIHISISDFKLTL